MKILEGYSTFLAMLTVILIVVPQNGHADEKCSEKSGNQLRDQEFGIALTPDDFLTSMFAPFDAFHSPWAFRDYFRPWRRLSSLSKDWGSTIKAEKDKFQINLDVQHFAPDEITVKAADGYVVIEGKHEEKEDEHGSVSRQFVRRYSLPEGTSQDTVVSQLSADGVLTITAPRKELAKDNERIVPITQTGPVRKEPKKDERSCKEEGNEGFCKASGK